MANTGNTANIATLSIAEIDALYPTPNSTLTTDFSVAPYYDDYDKKKKYYRILYRPGYAVQARELTQMQTMLQKQIARFGQHVFKEGSIVLPGEFSIELSVDYVTIKDSDLSNRDVKVKNFLNTKITNPSGVVAYVIDVADKDVAKGYPKTLFIRYLSASPADPNIKTFGANEVLTSVQGQAVTTDATVLDANDNPISVIGKGSRFIIREGVFFAKEHFIWFPTQSAILERYSTNPSARVGFQILETLVRYTDDSSLLDPALEASNYSAPGADRLELDPILTVKSYDDLEGPPDFVELFTVRGGVITELYQRTQYNILADELAKRTLDESGDYYVRGLGIRIREHLDIDNNNGYLTAENGGDSDLLAIGVEPGLAYVKGYERQLYTTNYLVTSKSKTFGNVSSQFSTASMGNYVIVNECVGNATHDIGELVYLLDGFVKRISDTSSTAPALGTIPSGVNTIGTARIRHVEWFDGDFGSFDCEFAVYLTDIKMINDRSFTEVKGLASTTFGADIVTENDKARLYDVDADTLLYYTGSDATKSISDVYGSQQLDYQFKRTSDISFDVTNGAASFTPTLDGPENFPYGTQDSLTRADRRDLIVSFLSDTTVPTGKIVSTRVSNNVFTITDSLSVYFNPGEKVIFSGNTKDYLITQVSGPTITVSENLPLVIAGSNITKRYKVGDILDLTGYSSTGLERTVSTAPKALEIELNEPALAGTYRITYPIAISNATQASKVLRSNCFVAIDLTQDPYTNNTSGPFSLGVPDVIKIRSIRLKSGATPIGTSDGSDVTSQFVLDNGQRDSYYDLASIIPKGGVLTRGESTLLVNFDCFETDLGGGKGFFVVDSYPVNDTETFNSETNITTAEIPVYTSPISRKAFDLRNHIDFRPIKTATASYTTDPISATVNPGVSGEFKYLGGATNLRLIRPSTEFTYDYSYYYARRDLVVMDKDGNVQLVTGVPSLNPITPAIPPNTMAVAAIFVAPFPSLAKHYAKILNREDLACESENLLNIRYTMRDIGVLKDRIVNLEYYASLNALQKSATDMAILDENGLNRFKNGIFVNDFTSHQFGDTRNPDYRIVVDPEEKCIRPLFTKRSIYYDYIPEESTNIKQTNDILTLPYTEELGFVEQKSVTSARNVELSSYRFEGKLYLDPPEDVWVDTDNTIPDEQITIGPDANTLEPTLVWNDWQKTIAGYYVGKNGTFTTTKPSGKFITKKNSPADIPVTEVTTESRTGTYTTYGVITNSVELGDKVVDIEYQHYIRPQVLDMNGKGFKGFTRVYVFFDGERMDQYCAPMNLFYYLLTPEQRETGYIGANTTLNLSNSANSVLANTSNITPFIPDYGAPLVTDANGEIFLCMKILENKFRVGQKEVVLTDSITNSVDATTFGRASFYASGLTQYKQGSILTTRQIVSNTSTLYDSNTTNTFVGFIDRPSCTAYSFLPETPPNVEGLFLSSVDVWYQRKHPTLGIWYEIREMDNAGNITRAQVPLSEVWLTADQIVASETWDETKYTRVTFPSPIFLYNNKEYAFVMHTEGLNPEAYVWIARLGEDDLTRPGYKYAARPLTGTFYTTNNNRDWNMVPDIDLKIRFNRAKFTGGTGIAVFGNRGTDVLAYDPTATLDSNITSDLRLSVLPQVTQKIARPITITYGETFVNQQITGKANNVYFKPGDVIKCTETNETATIISVRKSSSSCSSKGCDYTKISITSSKLQCVKEFQLYYGANGVLSQSV